MKQKTVTVKLDYLSSPLVVRSGARTKATIKMPKTPRGFVAVGFGDDDDEAITAVVRSVKSIKNITGRSRLHKRLFFQTTDKK